MTRRRFYAPPAAFSPDEKSVTLSADETRHLRDVLRLKAGDEIHVFDGAGKEFRCLLREFTRDGALADLIQEVKPAGPESPLDLTLAIALLKGEKFDWVIQKTTELGARRIVPLDTERSEIRIRNDEDAQKRVSRWRRIALEAAKQSGRAFVPEIDSPLGFESLVKTPIESSSAVARLLFAERSGRSLSETIESFHGLPKRVIAIVGPEGGWTDDEISLAKESGWKIVTLGGRILRAETAAIAISGLLQHRCGDFD